MALEFSRPKAEQARIADLVFTATALAPNEPEVLNCLAAAAHTYAMQAETGLRTLERKPLARSAHWNAVLGLNGTGRFPEALAVIERSLRIWPDWKFGKELRFLTLCRLERWEEARRHYPPDPIPVVQTWLLVAQGDLEAARRQAVEKIGEVRRDEPRKGEMDWANEVDRWVPLLVRLDLKEEALWLLRRALDAKVPVSPEFFLANPEYKSLQSDPRFARMGEDAQAVARPFLKRAEEALARGELPDYLKAPVADLGRMVRQPIPRA
jgi:hypothetical protein